MVFDDEVARLKEAFGEKCRIISEGPEAREDDPPGAWLEVQLPGLRLRLIRDRGRDHVDVKCADGPDGRWVPLEIVAVAFDSSHLDAYLEAFEATLRVNRDDSEWPADTTMIPDAIAFVTQFAHKCR